jgi:hypothetical protein
LPSLASCCFLWGVLMCEPQIDARGAERKHQCPVLVGTSQQPAPARNTRSTQHAVRNTQHASRKQQEGSSG